MHGATSREAALYVRQRTDREYAAGETLLLVVRVPPVRPILQHPLPPMKRFTATLFERLSRRFAQATRRGAAILVALCASFSFAQAVDAEPAERYRSDGWITTKVRAELFAVSANQSVHVHIKTVRGDVTLTGAVVSQDIVAQFTRAAKRPVGVKSVGASGLTVAAQ